MKKSIILAVLVLLCAFAAFAEKTVTATVLQNEMNLWVEKSEGMMEWSKINLNAGETIDAYISGSDEKNNPVALTKRSSWKNAKEGQTLLFTKVRYNEQDYYAISNRIVLGLKPAIVLENAATYTSKNFADIRKKGVPEGTVIAVDITDKTSGVYTLVKMAYYDEKAYVKREGYIMSSKISTTKDDISAYKLLKQAEKEPDEARKSAILNSITQLSISSKMNEMVKNQSEEAEKLKDLTPWGITDLPNQGLNYRFGIIDCKGKDRDHSPYDIDSLEYVNLRSLPGLDGEVICKLQLARGTLKKMTNETVTIDGVTEHWYYFDSGRGDIETGETEHGWVFGAYVREFYVDGDPW